MSDTLRTKADGSVRGVALTRVLRDADLGHSHGKFVRHEDIDEGDEAHHDDEDDHDAYDHDDAYKRHHRRPSERFAAVASLPRGARREPLETDFVPVAAAPVSSPIADKTSGGIAELCQYIQKLETEKRDLIDQVHFLRDQDATHRVNLSAASRRIDKLESLLRHASHASDSQQQVQLQIEAAIASERDRAATAAARLETMQRKYEDAERARQHAVFKLSELQTTMAEAATNRLLAPPHARLLPPSRPTSATTNSDATLDPTTGSSERLEKYKREIELLRQKLELREQQAQEKQKLAVELALRSAHLEHAAALEKVKLECEIKLSEWRHDEAVRAKEVEAAMEEDRYSIRLEMKHGMQRAQIEQRVYYLQAQAALAPSNAAAASSSSSASSGDGSEVPFSAMDEVLVRLQLELLRTRRFAALKKLLLIRQAVVDRALRGAIYKWKTAATQTTLLRRHAVLLMHRIATQFDKQDARASFHRWRLHAQQLTAEAQRQRVAACWNRMVAAERIVNVLQHRSAKRLACSFHRWRHQTSASGSGAGVASIATGASSPRGGEGSSQAQAATVTAGASGVSTEITAGVGGAELQDEIRKLHEQLASSKSEAWRYKRQLLKQFL